MRITYDYPTKTSIKELPCGKTFCWPYKNPNIYFKTDIVDEVEGFLAINLKTGSHLFLDSHIIVIPVNSALSVEL